MFPRDFLLSLKEVGFPNIVHQTEYVREHRLSINSVLSVWSSDLPWHQEKQIQKDLVASLSINFLICYKWLTWISLNHFSSPV